MKEKKKVYGIGIFLLGVILLLQVVSAGFGSSYIPEINGKETLQIPIGSHEDYFIYPQNAGDKILLVKINILNGSNLLTNTLQDIYEVPVNTTSDDFPIKLSFFLKNETSLIGEESFFSYELLSTLKSSEASGIVTFNPIGYKKAFYVKGIDEVITTPTPTPTPTTSGSNGNSKTYVKPVIETIPTPTPQIDVPKPENDEPELTEISIVPTSFISDFFRNISLKNGLFGLIGLIVLVSVSLSIKAYANRRNGKDFSNNNREIEVVRI